MSCDCHVTWTTARVGGAHMSCDCHVTWTTARVGGLTCHVTVCDLDYCYCRWAHMSCDCHVTWTTARVGGAHMSCDLDSCLL